MKKITLEEFAELAKNDAELKEKMIQIATRKGVDTGKQTDEMVSLAAEYGYELDKIQLLDMEELSDEDLENVAGGSGYNFLCIAFCKLMGMVIDCDRLEND